MQNNLMQESHHYQNKIKWDNDGTIIYRDVNSQYIDSHNKFKRLINKNKIETINDGLSFSKLANIPICKSMTNKAVKPDMTRFLSSKNINNINYRVQISETNFILYISWNLNPNELFYNFIVDLHHLFPALDTINIRIKRMMRSSLDRIYSMSKEDIYIYNYQNYPTLLKQNKFVLPYLPKIYGEYTEIELIFDLNQIKYIFNQIHKQLNIFLSELILSDLVSMICKYTDIINNINIYCHKINLTENDLLNTALINDYYIIMKTKIISLKPNSISTTLSIEDYMLGDQLLFVFYSNIAGEPMEILSIFDYLKIQHENTEITCDAFELHSMYNMRNIKSNNMQKYIEHTQIPTKLKKYVYIVNISCFIKKQFLFDDKPNNYITFTFYYEPLINRKDCYLYIISPYCLNK